MTGDGTADSSGLIVIPTVDADGDGLSAALAYATAGLYVVPIKRGTKHPGSVLGSGWPAKSTNDPKEIAAIWAGTDHGVAIHTARSGLIVFDVDHPENTPEVLARYLGSARYQPTRPRESGHGHYVFAVPPGREFRCSPGRLGTGWGEVRGGNSVIVVAPSVHPAADDPERPGHYGGITPGPVPVLPDELAELLGDQTDERATAVGDEVVERFIAEHDTGDRVALVEFIVGRFHEETNGGGSRHEAMVRAMVWALREATVGCYPAETAIARLRVVWVAVMDREKPHRLGGEWRGIIAWAVAQVLTADLDPVRARLFGGTPGLSLPLSFWQADPRLMALRQDCLTRLVVPDAVLVFLLAKIAAHIPPGRDVEVLDRGGVPLNLAVAAVADSGGGKSTAHRLADEVAVLTPAWGQQWDEPTPSGVLITRDMAERGQLVQRGMLSTPEGLCEAFYAHVRSVDGKRTTRQRARSNVWLHADEGAALVERLTDSQTSIGDVVRSAWSGADLGQANATQERQRFIPRGSYRCVLSMGLHIDEVAVMLRTREIRAGLPQRLLFAWCGQVATYGDDLGSGAVGEPLQIAIPLHGYVVEPELAGEIRARAVAEFVDPSARGEELASQRTPAVARLAALLTVLMGRTTGVDIEPVSGKVIIRRPAWELAETLFATSLAVARNAQRRNRADARAAEAASADRALGVKAEELELREFPEARVRARLRRYLRDAGADGWRWTGKMGLGKKFNGEDRIRANQALDELVESGEVTRTATAGGFIVRWSGDW